MKMFNKNLTFLLIFISIFSFTSSMSITGQTNIINLKVADGIPIESNGGVPVNIQDQHSEIIDLVMHRQLDNATLNQSYSIGDTSIYIETTGVAPSVGQIACLKEGTAFYQAEILSVTAITGNNYLIVLDSPLDFAFTTETFGCISTSNMAVDGSVTPQIFHISPCNLEDGTAWDITRIIFVMAGVGVGVSNDAPDDGDFGVAGELTKGIVLRSVNGITKNIFNVKRNGEFRLRAYDVIYTEKSKAGLFSVGVRRTFAGQSKNGVTVRLDADTCDDIEVIIQDDLTEMFGMKAVIQGHVVTY